MRHSGCMAHNAPHRLNSRDTIRRALAEHNGRPLSIDPSPSMGDTTLIIEEQPRVNAELFKELPVSPEPMPNPWIPLQDIKMKHTSLHVVSA